MMAAFSVSNTTNLEATPRRIGPWSRGCFYFGLFSRSTMALPMASPTSI